MRFLYDGLLLRHLFGGSVCNQMNRYGGKFSLVLQQEDMSVDMHGSPSDDAVPDAIP